jgi:hypothetical protein
MAAKIGETLNVWRTTWLVNALRPDALLPYRNPASAVGWRTPEDCELPANLVLFGVIVLAITTGRHLKAIDSLSLKNRLKLALCAPAAA